MNLCIEFWCNYKGLVEFEPDGDVDLQDLTTFAEDFLSPQSGLDADLDNNGTVDLQDFIVSIFSKRHRFQQNRR